MKARVRGRDAPARSRRPRAEARARRDPRHRVRGAAAPARARPPRPVDPVGEHARGARVSSSPRGTSITRRRAVRRRVPVPPHRRAPAAALGRAADAHPSRRPARRGRGWRACSGTATAAESTAVEQLDTEHRIAPGARALDPREALLRSAARGALGPARAADRRRGRGAAARVRLPRPARDARRAGRAHPRLQPDVAAHGAAAAAPARVVLRVPRPGPRAAAAAPARRGAGAVGEPRDRVPRHARARRSGPAASSARAGMLGDALRRQPEFVQTLGDDDALAEPKPRERFVERGDRRGPVARRPTRTRAAAGCADTSAASCCASRHATCSSFADLVDDRPRPVDARRSVPRGRRSSRSRRRCRSR